MKNKTTWLRFLIFTLAVGVCSLNAIGQAELRTLTEKDYGKWETLGFRADISDDGKWLIYSVSNNDKETELRLHNLSKNTVKVLKYGGNQTFSSDNRWLGYLVSPDIKTQEALNKEKKPIVRTFELLNLASGETTKIQNISTFGFSRDGKFLALKPNPDPKSDSKSSTIIVRNLASGADVTFGNVKEYVWSDQGSMLALTIDTRDIVGNGVMLFDGKVSMVLDSKEAVYSNVTWRRDSTDLAVLRTQKTDGYSEPTNNILVWKNVSVSGSAYSEFDPAKAAGFPADTRIVDKKPLQWSVDGSSVFFSIDKRAKSPEKPKQTEKDAPKETDGQPEIPELEIWNSKDVLTVPEQKATPPDNSYLSVWHLDKNKFVQLGSKDVKNIRFQPDSKTLLGSDQTPYEFQAMFGRPASDIYSVNIDTGERKKLLTNIVYVQNVSPSGTAFTFVKDDQYHLYNLVTGKDTNLTKSIDASFVYLDDDHPVTQKRPFEFSGWDKTGSYFVAHSEYDIWKFDAKTGKGTRLTDGKAEQIESRFISIDRRNRYVNIDEPFYVQRSGEWTKKSGYSKMVGGTLKPIYWGDSRASRLSVSKENDVAVFSLEQANDSPDYFVSRAGSQNLEQISKINPSEGQFKTGRAELIEYVNANGKKLQGSLYYPDDYTPDKKYPMITYIYERLSDGFHSYSAPSKSNYYSRRVMTSKGYFVFNPDIVFDAGDPGVSSVKTLEIAVKAVVDKGLVDPKKVGLVGHSWGGYQAAFAVTGTNIFAAAVAGAGISNLLTMYGTVTPAFQSQFESKHFEVGQERMMVPPWENINAYLRNSAIPNIDKMQTPLLMEVGDADTNVNPGQAHEMYNAARRAKKEMVLLVYAKEGHGLTQAKNQIDYQRRILEWFGYYLKGDPPKSWIKDNIPYEKQQELLKKRELD